MQSQHSANPLNSAENTQPPAPTTLELQAHIQELQAYIQQMSLQPSVSSQALSIARSKTLQRPPEFDGKDRRACETFLSHIKLYLGSNAVLYPTDRDKVMFASSYLRDAAFKWFEPLLKSDDTTILDNFQNFQDELIRNLGDPDRLRSLTRELQTLKQTGSAAAYSSRFCQVSAYLNWNDDALRDQFYSGLKSEVKDALAYSNVDWTSFKELSHLAIRLDNRLFERKSDRFTGTKPAPNYTPRVPAPSFRASDPGAMDIDATKSRKFQPLTDAERKRRRDNKLCMYCGDPGHFAGQCPKKHSSSSPARIQATISDDQAKNE
jgi:5-methylcytosine-specific restriction endonuclease McrA